jgi:hypothetical protein
MKPTPLHRVVIALCKKQRSKKSITKHILKGLILQMVTKHQHTMGQAAITTKPTPLL